VSARQQEAYNRTFTGWYINAAKKHSFIMFGLPFMTMLFGATYMLSFFTELRYEKYDAHVTAMTEEEALSVAKGRRKVNLNEEYYVCGNLPL